MPRKKKNIEEKNGILKNSSGMVLSIPNPETEIEKYAHSVHSMSKDYRLFDDGFLAKYPTEKNNIKIIDQVAWVVRENEREEIILPGTGLHNMTYLQASFQECAKVRNAMMGKKINISKDLDENDLKEEIAEEKISKRRKPVSRKTMSKKSTSKKKISNKKSTKKSSSKKKTSKRKKSVKK